MHVSGSMLYTAIERIRAMHDDPELDAKYSDDFIVRQLIMPAYAEVMGRINMNADNPIIIRSSITVAAGQEYYQLPPAIQEIMAVRKIDQYGNLEWDARPRTQFSPCGPGWSIEGNLFCLRPFPTAAEIFDIWYIPSGDVGLHYNSPTSPGTGISIGVDNLTFTLPAAPSLGILDRRPNAYAGMILRTLDPANGEVWQERVIATYDSATRTGTVRVAFDPSLSGINDFSYEIAPPYSQALWEAVSMRSALKLGVIRRVKSDTQANLTQEYAAALKTIRDNLNNLNARNGSHWDRDTIDHPSRLFSYLAS